MTNTCDRHVCKVLSLMTSCCDLEKLTLKEASVFSVSKSEAVKPHIFSNTRTQAVLE